MYFHTQSSGAHIDFAGSYPAWEWSVTIKAMGI